MALIDTPRNDFLCDVETLMHSRQCMRAHSTTLTMHAFISEGAL